MLNPTITVSQLNRYVKAVLEENQPLSNLLVKGEISNFSEHYSSGHMYFSLKDEAASVKAVMFRSYAQQLRFRPQNGQKVLVSCCASLFERDGAYQLYVYDIQPDGAGALALAFEQLKQKLMEEGLFDPARKLPLPRFPLRIGVVTSAAGAALQDILNILQRRWPVATVVLAPVSVQGQQAAEQIAAAIRFLDQRQLCEVILLGRGGGSTEDLWAFNSEHLARTISACKIPVISAVGHEVDYTIADFVADCRAPTPSAAAELVSPDKEELFGTLQELKSRMDSAIARRIALLSAKLEIYRQHRALQSQQALIERYTGQVAQVKIRLEALMKRQLAQQRELLSSYRQRLQAPQTMLKSHQNKLASLQKELQRAMLQAYHAQQKRVSRQASLLHALSPLQVLQRGYAIVFLDGEALTDCQKVGPGDRLAIRLSRGEILAVVEKSQWGKQHEKGTDFGAGDGAPG